MTILSNHPFGNTILSDDIIKQIAQCRSWEDKYRYIILLGKKLPSMPSQLKTEKQKITGCESEVWFAWQEQKGHFHFNADSDARIVKGLLSIILAKIEGLTWQQIKEINFEHYFEKMDLLAHMSQSRVNGIRALIDKIQTLPPSQL